MSRFRLGKLPPRIDGRTLRLARYLTPALPAPPATLHNTKAVTAWPLYANDHLADCTCATAGDLIGLWSTLAKRPTWPLEKDVVAAYSQVSGYRPGQPNTDRGAVVLDVLRHWRSTGIGGHKIGAFVSVNPRNLHEVKAAISIFGAVYAGALLPDDALSPAQAGHIWRLGPAPSGRPNRDNGHAFMVGGYNTETFDGATWGMRQRMTFEWWSACVEEAFAIVSVDQLNTAGRSPAGLDLMTLNTDLSLITGVR